MGIRIEPDLFRDEVVDPETRALNAAIIEQMRAAPDPFSMPAAEVRAMRARGEGPFPLAPKSPRARTFSIPGPGGDLPLRLIAPETPKGVYLHIHGGGWSWGAADQQDPRLERIVDRTGFAALSIEYRLAPEHPYPCGPDDCEAAALWLMRQAESRFGTTRFAIGGESAGAHLAVLTLLRLRDRHGAAPFLGANLEAGCYDLTMTPSAANWGETPLVLHTRGIRRFADYFLAGGADPASPEVSPLRARLDGLPPALFTVGTRDPLLDDTLFMAARWAAAGNSVDLAIHPGGAHVFTTHPSALSETARSRIDAFLSGL